MKSTVCNRRGYQELGLEIGKYDMVLNHENQNANDEGQSAIAALLKTERGMMVDMVDEAQTPHFPTILRPKREQREPDTVPVPNLRD
eukprot:1628209-Karenia_brevis.AAC.1